MTDDRQTSGLRTRLWIAGKFLNRRDPVPVVVTRKRLEAKTPMSNGMVHVDRLFVTDGLPNTPETFEFALSWDTITEPDILEHLDTLQGVGQLFYVGIWKQFYPVYDGDGTTARLLLPRLQLWGGPDSASSLVTPPVEWEEYSTRVTVYDRPYGPGAVPTELTVVHKTAANIETGNPSADEVWIEDDGHAAGSAVYSTMRFGTAPPDGHDRVRVAYIPAFRVAFDSEEARSYSRALQEPRILKLLEA